MLDAKEIDAAIAELEYKESSFSNYAKLADLYAIRDKMNNGPEPMQYDTGFSRAPAVEISGESEFLRAVSGKNIQSAWAIMDDLMDTLRVVNVRVYNSVMERIIGL